MATDRDQAVTLAIGQIEKQFGKGAIMRLGEGNVAPGIEVLPSGCLSLDIALGIGGLLQRLAPGHRAVVLEHDDLGALDEGLRTPCIGARGKSAAPGLLLDSGNHARLLCTYRRNSVDQGNVRARPSHRVRPGESPGHQAELAREHSERALQLAEEQFGRHTPVHLGILGVAIIDQRVKLRLAEAAPAGCLSWQTRIENPRPACR